MGTHINPCTGSFSNDFFDPDMNCETFLKPENPISSPTSDTNAPLSAPPTSSPIDDDNIIYACPGTSCSYEFGENVLTFSYVYTAEVSDTKADPRVFPTLIEEDLVKIVAESILGYCILPTEGVRNLLQISNEEGKKYERRRLNVRRRLQPTGVCSYPKDYLIPTESCDPTSDINNACHVIQGNISIFVEEGDNQDDIINNVREIIQQAMEQDALVSTEEGITKVTYIEDNFGGGSGQDDDNDNTDNIGGIGDGGVSSIVTNTEDDSTDMSAGIIIGSCLAVLVALIGFIVIRRKQEEEEEEEEGPFGLVVFPGLYDAPDENDLGKRCICQDVKQCKSQTCRCYDEDSHPVSFVASSKDPKAINKTKKTITPFGSFENPLRFLFGSKSEDSSIQKSDSQCTDEFY